MRKGEAWFGEREGSRARRELYGLGLHAEANTELAGSMYCC